MHAAHAERSTLGDAADVVEAGDCEIETTVSRQTARGTRPEQEKSIQLACGVGFMTEVTFGVARRGDGGTSESEFGLEGKTTLRPRTDGRAGWALAYGITGLRAQSGAWRGGEHFVAVEASYQPSPDWATEAMLGTSRHRALRHDSTIWLLALERALIADQLEGRAELSGDDRNHPKLELSLRFAIKPENASLRLAYAIKAGPQRERQVRLGLKFGF